MEESWIPLPSSFHPPSGSPPGYQSLSWIPTSLLCDPHQDVRPGSPHSPGYLRDPSHPTPASRTGSVYCEPRGGGGVKWFHTVLLSAIHVLILPICYHNFLLKNLQLNYWIRRPLWHRLETTKESRPFWAFSNVPTTDASSFTISIFLNLIFVSQNIPSGIIREKVMHRECQWPEHGTLQILPLDAYSASCSPFYRSILIPFRYDLRVFLNYVLQIQLCTKGFLLVEHPLLAFSANLNQRLALVGRLLLLDRHNE